MSSADYDGFSRPPKVHLRRRLREEIPPIFRSRLADMVETWREIFEEIIRCSLSIVCGSNCKARQVIKYQTQAQVLFSSKSVVRTYP
jgi:hypothetical protein